MTIKTLARWIIALFFVLAGLNHFRSPEVYLGMMPPGMPQPGLINVISGAAEALGGIGLLLPATRRAAAAGLVLLLVVVFPANVHVARMGHMPGFNFSPLVLWLRLPCQAVFIAWVAWVGWSRPTKA